MVTAEAIQETPKALSFAAYARRFAPEIVTSSGDTGDAFCPVIRVACTEMISPRNPFACGSCPFNPLAK